ncbi:MAG TPA: IS4 family transposase [Gammaproteobacteria bacterium]|nr:IS4 family transposase [Gammaproteobacteria bacterium]
MHAGQLVFAQLMRHLPPMVFERCVARYGGNHKVKSFTCMDQYLCMAFAQLTFRESLRDIEACLRAQAEKRYHMGVRGQVSRNTLAHANATRDWRIYADFAQRLIGIARALYVNEPFGVDLTNTAYALDSTTIDLSLSLFPWAPFRSTRSAVKMHTLLDLRGNIPSFIHVSDGKFHDVNILDQLIPEAGAFYIMDRGYIDFLRLYRLHQAGSFFVTRAKKNLDAQRRYSHPVDRATGLIFDQTLVLQGYQSAKDYPESFRGIRYRDPETSKRLLFITNNTVLPALSICRLYKARWQVELFFRWIKQHLRIKAFFGTSENAVKSQIWIAVSVYVLVAIVRKRLALSLSLYEMLQILSLTLFEKTALTTVLSRPNDWLEIDPSPNQLILFD